MTYAAGWRNISQRAPSMVLNLTVKVRYGGTYQPTISEAQAIHREVEVEEVCSKIVAR